MTKALPIIRPELSPRKLPISSPKSTPKSSSTPRSILKTPQLQFVQGIIKEGSETIRQPKLDY